MLFYGASGHAKVVIESWIASGGNVSGVFDDNAEINKILGFPVSVFSRSKNTNEKMVISIGSNNVRKKLSVLHDLRYGIVVDPSVKLSVSATIGKGSVLLPGSIINAETKIGEHVIINTRASIDHDCVIGNFVHIAPGAVVCGGVQVGEGTLIGAGSTIIQSISIGKWVTIGAGSVIIANVPDYAVVTGVPGKIKSITEHQD